MPPFLALILCGCFIVWLIRKDMSLRRAGSSALLLPGIWLAIQGSRPLSYWLGSGTGESNVEGNLINTVTFGVFIFVALLVLQRRNFVWGEFIRNNKALVVIYLYFACSAAWSEMPFVTLKRLIKDFSCVLIALVFLTEQDPALAVRTVFARVACVLFPLSLVFGKYFPEIGRGYTSEGSPMFTGVATQKNSLGEVVLVLGLMLLWDLVENRKLPAPRRRLLVPLGMLILGLLLLVKSDSQTSLLCFLLGSFIFWWSGRLVRMKQGRRVLIGCLVGAIMLAGMEETFGISAMVLKLVGRNPTLTGRTDIWRLVLEQPINPLVGNGFYVFWDSEKAKAVIESFMKINSTHNGYLEMYLDGGWAVELLLGLLLLVGCKRVMDRLFMPAPLGKMGLIIWVTAMLYNLSESSFFRLDVLWFALLLVTIECPTNLKAQKIRPRASNP